MTIKRLSKTLTANDNDKQIIETMKKVGAWEKMKPESLVDGMDRTLINGDYVFHWSCEPTDSGYTAFHSTNRVELANLFIKIGGASK